MKTATEFLLFSAVAAVALGCGSGGTNDVQLVGMSHGEEPGPKGISGKLGGGSSGPSSYVGTITALCVEACSHLRAANCKGAPAHMVTECASDCSTAGAHPECSDENAFYFRCVIGAPVTCTVGGQPRVDCEEARAVYDDCVDQGASGYAGCIAQPQSNYACSYSTPGYSYYQCSSYNAPDPSCVALGSMVYCCP